MTEDQRAIIKECEDKIEGWYKELEIVRGRGKSIMSDVPDEVIANISWVRGNIVRISAIYMDAYLISKQVNMLYKKYKKIYELSLGRALAHNETVRAGKDKDIRQALAEEACQAEYNDMFLWECLRDDIKSFLEVAYTIREDQRESANDGMVLISLLKSKGLIDGWGRST